MRAGGALPSPVLPAANYAPTLPHTPTPVAACRKIAATVKGLKRGYPGLDLVIFPEYSTQGFHPDLWPQLTTTLDGPEVAVFKQACTDAGARRSAANGAFIGPSRGQPRSAAFSLLVLQPLRCYLLPAAAFHTCLLPALQACTASSA